MKLTEEDVGRLLPIITRLVDDIANRKHPSRALASFAEAWAEMELVSARSRKAPSECGKCEGGVKCKTQKRR